MSEKEPVDLAERDIVKDREIDEFNLMKELKHLPSILGYWGEQYQEAKSTAQELKDKYSYIQDKVLLDITATKTAEEGKKPTDKTLAAYGSCDKAVIEAYNKYVEAERQKNLLYVCAQAIETKMSAIKLMVELRKTEYFNTNMTIDAEEMTGTTSERIRNQYK